LYGAAIENGRVPLFVHAPGNASMKIIRRYAATLGPKVPLRAPHHTISATGLLGSTSPQRDGEVQKAKGGILFLAEAAEFSSPALCGVAHAYKGGLIAVIGTDRTWHNEPVDFQLILGTQPCPCGHYEDSSRACICGERAIARYRERISRFFFDVEVIRL